MIEPNYNDLDSFWTIDFKDILDNLDSDYNEEESLSEFLLELEEEDEKSDKHPLNELIKDIH